MRRRTLRRLATTAEGARLASALVEALMARSCPPGTPPGAERTAQKLQIALCPMFFGGDAAPLLPRAPVAAGGARRARRLATRAAAERLVAEALAALLEVPAAGNLSATMAGSRTRLLLTLGALPLCAAAAARARSRGAPARGGVRCSDDVFVQDRWPFRATSF